MKELNSVAPGLGDFAPAEREFRASPAEVGMGVTVSRVITKADSRLCAMLGYERDELVGLPMRVLYANDEEFKRGGQIYLELQSSGTGVIETRFVRKDGTYIDVLLSASRVDSTARPQALAIFVLDVSKTRQSERELFWQNRELTAFHRISEVMLSGQAEQSIFDTIAREASDMTDFPMVSIELCDFERAVMIYRGAFGIPLEDMPTPFEVPMDVALSGQVAYSGEVLIEQNISDRREYAAPIMRRLGVRTCLCVPIKTNGTVAGTLSLSHHEPINVPPRVVKAATSLANYLATLFDRLKAREAVSQSEAELSSVYDRAPSVLCLFDEHKRLVRANPAALEFTGHARDWRTPMTAREFFHCQPHAEDFESCGNDADCLGCSLRQALRETLSTGKSLHMIRMTKRLFRPDERANVVLLVSTARIQLNGTVRVLMCLEDITKSERADEQIRSQAALLDIAGDAIFVRDFTGRISYWNEGAHRLYGWKPDEIAGQTINDLNLAGDGAESALALEAVQQSGEWAGEMRNWARDGRELVVQSRWTLMRGQDGKPTAILVVNTDMTENKRLQTQFLRSQRLESIGTLASGLAHDLNNVLAPMMMAVQFLRESMEDEGMRACLQTLETCSRRGADIIRQVLMFARGVEGERILLNPKHLVREMERIIRETFPRSIELQVTVSRDPCTVLGDATQVQQILMNLCVNARDAMPEGGTLTLRLEKMSVTEPAARVHPKAKPGDYVMIVVQDSGIGIPRELMDKIFDPFFTTKPLGQGTGLGLPTVLGITENHGGFLLLESKSGAGTTFKVCLPAAPEGKEESGLGRAEAIIGQGKGELILVVDDEPAVRRLMCAILNRHGYRTAVACHGREGLAMFAQQRHEIELVVSDLMMPQLDGPGMIRAIREMDSQVKAIIITGLGEDSRVAHAKSAGVDSVLSKPFTAGQLLTAVQQLLKQETPPADPAAAAAPAN